MKMIYLTLSKLIHTASICFFCTKYAIFTKRLQESFGGYVNTWEGSLDVQKYQQV